jgi:hypothetical protein
MLRRAIHSIRSQTLQDFEFVILAGYGKTNRAA